MDNNVGCDLILSLT